MKLRVARFVMSGLRGLSLCFGVFIAVNAIVALRDGGVDSNLWWIDLRKLPGSVSVLALVVLSLVLVAFALKPKFEGRSRVFGFCVAGAFALWALRDIVVVLGLMADGRLPAWNVPFSAVVVAFFVALAVGIAKAPSVLEATDRAPQGRRASLVGAALGAGLFFALIPIGVMATFGKTDYRIVQAANEQSLAVVFGAGVYKDGTPSLALSDRTMTGVELFKEGVASTLYFSGGPGRGATHETQAMRKLALDAGVPDEAILIDPDGLSTWATAKHTASLVEASAPAPTHVFAVSHGYHLPRIELAFQMYGLDVLTVPATETRPLARRHYFALREVAGFWAYWARRAIS